MSYLPVNANRWDDFQENFFLQSDMDHIIWFLRRSSANCVTDVIKILITYTHFYCRLVGHQSADFIVIQFEFYPGLGRPCTVDLIKIATVFISITNPITKASLVWLNLVLLSVTYKSSETCTTIRFGIKNRWLGTIMSCYRNIEPWYILPLEKFIFETNSSVLN